jgi:dTDP-4-dehydrorhamnose 3,5-epimerase
MRFMETAVRGAFAIDLDLRADHRGFFARTWCALEFQARGLNPRIAQVNISASRLRGTLRGMHLQLAPCREAKTVSCVRGAIYDVVLDLRPDSPTFLRWAAVELSAGCRRSLHIPEGCAHGFQTLEADSEVLYFMSELYSPSHGRGVRYDDPAFGIEWPLPVEALSEADRTWPAFEPKAWAATHREAGG